MAEDRPRVIGGVDTHGRTHHAAVLEANGAVLGSAEFAASSAGYRRLLAWMCGHGELACVGVEGTGTYGAGLARHLLAAGVPVVEVERPERRLRRQHGKSDPIDAEAAARAVLAGTARALPKGRDGIVESIRALRTARSSAVKARSAAINSLKAMVVSAPAEQRERLDGLSTGALVTICAALRPDHERLADALQATKAALRSLARRIAVLGEEIAELDAALTGLVRKAAPQTIALMGVGVEHAGQLLVTAGDNPERLRSEAAFAHLCGVAPIPASSGRTTRHRLHRGGDRAANRALHLAVVVRLRYDARTRAYVERRTREGLSKMETIRCLKRYLAREVYRTLSADLRELHGLDGL
jgi:transposase